MRDVSTQLADYFDATVERVTPEDVFAGSDVLGSIPPLKPAPRYQLRPAWTGAIAFMMTLTVIGGSLGVMMLLRSQLSPAGSGFAPSAISSDSGTDADWLWVIMAGLVIVALGAVIVMMVRWNRSRIETNGGLPMTTTTDKPQTEASVQKLHTTNRVLTVAVVVLALLAIGFGGWAIYQATTADEGTAMPDDVAALMDEWEAANRLNDGSVADLYAIGGYHLAGANRVTGEDLAPEFSPPGWTHEWTTEPYLIVDDVDSRYVVARGLEISNGSITSNSALVFELKRNTDGQLEILQTNWVWQN
jgi:hypothetical protein